MRPLGFPDDSNDSLLVGVLDLIAQGSKHVGPKLLKHLRSALYQRRYELNRLRIHDLKSFAAFEVRFRLSTSNRVHSGEELHGLNREFIELIELALWSCKANPLGGHWASSSDQDNSFRKIVLLKIPAIGDSDNLEASGLVI